MTDNEFFIQILTCDDKVFEVTPKPGQQFGKWATLADMLLTGQQLLPAGTPADTHPIKVQLAFQKDDDSQPVAVASVYLLCPCDIDVISGQRVQSALVAPTTSSKPNITTPSLILPR